MKTEKHTRDVKSFHTVSELKARINEELDKRGVTISQFVKDNELEAKVGVKANSIVHAVSPSGNTSGRILTVLCEALGIGTFTQRITVTRSILFEKNETVSASPVYKHYEDMLHTVSAKNYKAFAKEVKANQQLLRDEKEYLLAYVNKYILP